MVVAESIYGWVTKGATNDGGRITVEIMPAGGSEKQTFTSDVIYGVINAMTGGDQGEAIVSRCGLGTFAEICKNAAGEVIDIRRVEAPGLTFDSAPYGGDLTKIGSTVKLRGAQYTDSYRSNATGDTGFLTGLSGRMVAYGWLLGKDLNNKTISLGDGNRVVRAFDEEYNVADDVKVYTVNNYISGINPECDFASTATTFADMPVSTLDSNGDIYNTASDARYQAVVIFDADYTKYADDPAEAEAKVEEIYVFTAHENVDSWVGKIPQSTRVTSDLSATTQGEPAPRSAPFLVAADPTTVVEGKMYTIGDIEVNCPLFKGADDDGHGGIALVQFDAGWPKTGYQYMKNIARQGYDVRDLDAILIPHGHGDHYGSAFEEWETIVRAGEDAYAPTIYESYEDTIGYDYLGFPEIGGILNDHPVLCIITDWYPLDEWQDLGDGLKMMTTMTPGHSQGCGSAVFEVTVGPGGMPNAKMNSAYDADRDEWVNTYADYKEGDQIFFCYMGGYGINGLDSVTAGFRRTSFVASLRYLETVACRMPTSTGGIAAGVYNLAQHTNQYPYIETAAAMKMYNEANGTNYPFLHFMREGTEEVINFCEKRASAMLYSDYTAAYMEKYTGTDSADSIDGVSAKRANSSPFYEYEGIRIKTDITSPRIEGSTVEDKGPYKHAGGRVTIALAQDVDVLVMHGYDVFLNRGVVPASANIMTTDRETGLANQNWNLNRGFAFAKDGFVHDPDKWYVQVAARVDDDYDGNVYSNEGPNAGIEFISGPVDRVRGKDFVEILRTGAMTKAEAEALAASLKKGGVYTVNIQKTGDIINDEEDIMNTFVEVESPLAESVELQVLPATGRSADVQQPFHDALKDGSGNLTDYYRVVYSGYFDLPLAINSSTNTQSPNGEEMDCDLRMYIPEGSRYSQPSVFLMVPSGVDPCQFMVDSGWKKTADDNKITVFLLMPPLDRGFGDTITGWGSWDSYTDAQAQAYIKAAVDTAGQRPGIQTVSYCYYGVAYGDAAPYMTQYVMENPTAMAGAFIIGDPGDKTDLMAALRTTASREEGVMISEIAVPFGVVAPAESNTTSAIVDYFKAANQTVGTAAEKDGFTFYAPDENADTRQPDSEPVAGVYYKVAAIEDCKNDAFAQSLFDIFNTVRRYPGYLNTELRAYDDVYTDAHYTKYTSLSALGRYTYGGDISAAGDGAN
jgi:hypothetical protein